MTTEPADQPTFTYAVINGQMVAQTAATLKTLTAASGSPNIVYKFGKNFTLTVGHQSVVYKSNTAYSLSPSVIATLLAANAPMVAV